MGREVRGRSGVTRPVPIRCYRKTAMRLLSGLFTAAVATLSLVGCTAPKADTENDTVPADCMRSNGALFRDFCFR